MALPHKTGHDTVRATTFTSILRVDSAYSGRLYAIRLRGQGITWRVVADGHCGRDTLASGTIAAGTPAAVRVSGLPETIGAATLLVEARLTSGATPVQVLAEVSWLPINCPCED